MALYPVHDLRTRHRGRPFDRALRPSHPGKNGAVSDFATAIDVNKEVYDFLASISHKFGIGFWKQGAGIIHQVVLENYAFPGGMWMIEPTPHTPQREAVWQAWSRSASAARMPWM